MSVAIIYWSGTGNTEAMAKAIEAGIRQKGEAVDVFTADQANSGIVDKYERIAFGCPSMGEEELEEEVFEPFFTSIEDNLQGKKVALFGSYGWGDGEWMRNWYDRTKNTGASLYGEEGFIQQEEPDESVCKEFGEGFAGF